MAVQVKTERIDVRVTKEHKNLLDQAAKIKNTNISDYILSIALKRAELDIKENERIMVSDRAREQLLEALSNPSEPSQILIDLFK